jgi:hypothetical protein
MNRIFATACLVPFLALAAKAQDTVVANQVRVMSLRGGVMGKTVKGAPYNGTEITETNQVLGDGTRIHNETQTQVWRDSEGRVRRETGDQVMIYDPVANASYSLNTKNQTARKLPLGTYLFTTTPDGGNANVNYFRFSTAGAGGPLPPPELDAAKAKLEAMQADLAAKRADEEKAVQAKRKMEIATLDSIRTISTDGVMLKGAARGNAVSRALGRRMMEGVNADGTSETSTIEAGAIGNDRPIQSVNERWYSPDLQTVMMSRHSDPRTGDETFKLVNVSRTEPPQYLFQIPAGYQIVQ